MSKGNMLKHSRTSWTVSLIRRRWWPHGKPVPDSLYNDVDVVRVFIPVLYFILGFAMLVILLYLLDNHFCDWFSAFDVYGLIFVGLIVLCVKDTVRVFKFVDANCRCLKKNCILRGSLLQSQYINMSVAIYICWFFHFVVWCDSRNSRKVEYH